MVGTAEESPASERFVVSIPAELRATLQRLPRRIKILRVSVPLGASIALIPIIVAGIELGLAMGPLVFLSLLILFPLWIAIIPLQRRTTRKVSLLLARLITSRTGQGEGFREALYEKLINVSWDQETSLSPSSGPDGAFRFTVRNEQEWEAVFSHSLSSITLTVQPINTSEVGIVSAVRIPGAYVDIHLPNSIQRMRKQIFIWLVLTPAVLIFTSGFFVALVVVPNAYTSLSMVATGAIVSGYMSGVPRLFSRRVNSDIARFITLRLKQTPAFENSLYETLRLNKLVEVKQTKTLMSVKTRMILKEVVLTVGGEPNWSVKLTEDQQGYRLKRLQ